MPAGGEFQLIERYLSALGARRQDVDLGVGDDAALVTPAGGSLVLALDTLVEGVHFPTDLPAYWVGYRALAVNLSDLAAMGGDPAWALLGLTLPRADEQWVSGFAAGLHALAVRHGVAVVGGDVTHGPLTISLQISGYAPARPLRRDGARPGEHVWVSGRPGDAMGGLTAWQDPVDRQEAAWAGLRSAFLAPEPKVALGRRLSGIATAAIDVSDGLLADAGHIAAGSGVAVDCQAADCRPSARLRRYLGESQALDRLWRGGDDYELCFTAPGHAAPAVETIARLTRTPVRRIGRIDVGEGVFVDGAPANGGDPGYQHFRR